MYPLHLATVLATALNLVHGYAIEDLSARDLSNTCSHASASTTTSIGPYICSPTVKPAEDRRTMQKCGQQGTVQYQERLTPSPYKAPDFANCSQACIENIQCRSLSWIPADRSCELSPDVVVEEGFSPSNNSGVEFYHVHCFGQDCSCPAGTSQAFRNPSFEKGVPGNPSAAVNWTLGGNARVGTAYRFHKEEKADVRCYDGEHYVLMDGPSDFVAQNLSCLTPGNTYTVSFYYNVLEFQQDPTFNMTARVGSAPVTFASPFYVSPNINEESYSQALGTFVAAEQNPTFALKFHSDTDPLDWPGVSLDFFSICV